MDALSHCHSASTLPNTTANHREIWKEFSERPELSRVLDAFADVTEQPITPAEAEFLNHVILHLSSVYYALRDEMVIKQEGLRSDICSFFSLPIPQAVWEKTKLFQNDDFVEFVESCRHWKWAIDPVEPFEVSCHKRLNVCV